MGPMRSRNRSFLALILIVAFSAATWTTCIEGAVSSAMQQMACCKKADHQCGSSVSPADCCKKDESGRRDAVTLAKIEPLRAPAPMVVTWAILPVTDLLDSAHRPIAQAPSPPPLSSGPPPYVAFSTLLI
jgi:hypothetical protein